MTPRQLARLYAIEEVIILAGLTGHHRPGASRVCVAKALRECGFTQRRDWTAAGRNRRFWKFDGEANGDK